MEAIGATPDRLVRLGVVFRESKTLLSAVELDVFTLLAQRPLELVPLAEKSGVHARGARDFFDALVALGLLERD
jgi:Dimerisation domain